LFLIDDTKDSDATNKHENKAPKTETRHLASEKQRKLIYLLYKKKNGKEMPEEEKEKIRKLSFKQASDLITNWKAQTEELVIRGEDKEAPEIDINDIPSGYTEEIRK